jgi:hypothetical protein
VTLTSGSREAHKVCRRHRLSTWIRFARDKLSSTPPEDRLRVFHRLTSNGSPDCAALEIEEQLSRQVERDGSFSVDFENYSQPTGVSDVIDEMQQRFLHQDPELGPVPPPKNGHLDRWQSWWRDLHEQSYVARRDAEKSARVQQRYHRQEVAAPTPEPEPHVCLEWAPLARHDIHFKDVLRGYAEYTVCQQCGRVSGRVHSLPDGPRVIRFGTDSIDRLEGAAIGALAYLINL